MLLDTVNSVLAARSVPREIVVVDQSAAPNAELAATRGARGCEVRYIHSSTSGTSLARNLGIREASEDVVVILDDDMLVGEDSLELLLDGREGRADRTVTTGRVLAAPPDGPGRPQPSGVLITRTEAEVFRGRQPRQVVPGPNVALPRRVMLEIGGYDERLGPGTRFPAGEDRDLSLRLLDAGCEVRHVPDAIALHRSWRNRRELVGVQWRYARGVGGYYAKHASLRDRYTLQLAARELRTRAALGIRSLVKSPTNTARHAVSIAGLLLGGAEWFIRHRLLRPRATGRVAVLAYHAIADLHDDSLLREYSVPPQRFAEHLDALLQWGWRFVDLDMALRAFDGQARLPARAALLTFDDGYADLLTDGLPLLAERGIPAVVFAVAEHVGGVNEWDLAKGAQELRLLDADGLRALASAGVEIGSHTSSHPDLTRVGPPELEAELDGSAAQLEALGVPRPRALSYPYGETTQEIAAAAQRAGYSIAFTARPEIAKGRIDRFAVPRIEVFASDTPPKLRARLAAARLPTRRLRARVFRRFRPV